MTSGAETNVIISNIVYYITARIQKEAAATLREPGGALYTLYDQYFTFVKNYTHIVIYD